MKITKIKTVTFDTGFKNFMVDIVETDYGYSVFLYKSGYCIKSMMFGLREKNIDEVVEITESNLLSYMSEYEEEYCFE